MKVETYLVDEVEAQTPEECEGARALVNKLGLAGQKRFTDSAADKPQPWRVFTHEEHLGLRALCPQTTDLSTYASGVIPLRVLEVAERAMDSGFFDKLVVWHPQDVRKDPVLVGEVFGRDSKGDKQPWLKSEYILARWGEALDEIPALLRNARESIKAKLLDLRQQIDNDISRLDKAPIDKLAPDFSTYYSSPIR